MCRHILNAQVSVRAPCCKRWFDCPECHAAASDHPLQKTAEIILACKKCSKVFRKDSALGVEESDEYCPHCDNHYVIEAVGPVGGPNLVIEEGPPCQELDGRIKQKPFAIPEDEMLELMS